MKRTSLYHDYKDGGLRMIDIETIVEALRLAWIPRLLKIGNLNWKTVPDYFLKQYGGLGFLLKCNYQVKDFNDIPRFTEIFCYFLTNLNPSIIIEMMFNNKEILIGGQPLFQEWLNGGIKTIMDRFESCAIVIKWLIWECFQRSQTKHNAVLGCQNSFCNFTLWSCDLINS